MKCPSRNEDDAFTLVELLAAMCVASILALALTREILLAHQALRSAAAWMQATQVAATAVERLRAGDSGPDDNPADGFAVSWERGGSTGYPDLERVVVIVEWQDGGDRSFTLEALIPARH